MHARRARRARPRQLRAGGGRGRRCTGSAASTSPASEPVRQSRASSSRRSSRAMTDSRRSGCSPCSKSARSRATAAAGLALSERLGEVEDPRLGEVAQAGARRRLLVDVARVAGVEAELLQLVGERRRTWRAGAAVDELARALGRDALAGAAERRGRSGRSTLSAAQRAAALAGDGELDDLARLARSSSPRACAGRPRQAVKISTLSGGTPAARNSSSWPLSSRKAATRETALGAQRRGRRRAPRASRAPSVRPNRAVGVGSAPTRSSRRRRAAPVSSRRGRRARAASPPPRPRGSSSQASNSASASRRASRRRGTASARAPR